MSDRPGAQADRAPWRAIFGHAFFVGFIVGGFEMALTSRPYEKVRASALKALGNLETDEDLRNMLSLLADKVSTIAVLIRELERSITPTGKPS